MPIKLKIRPIGQLVRLLQNTETFEGPVLTGGYNVKVGSHSIDAEGKVWYKIAHSDTFYWVRATSLKKIK